MTINGRELIALVWLAVVSTIQLVLVAIPLGKTND